MKTFAKAIAAGITAAMATLGTALLDDGISNNEWIGIIGGTLLAFWGVYAAPKNAEG